MEALPKKQQNGTFFVAATLVQYILATGRLALGYEAQLRRRYSWRQHLCSKVISNVTKGHLVQSLGQTNSKTVWPLPNQHRPCNGLVCQILRASKNSFENHRLLRALIHCFRTGCCCCCCCSCCLRFSLRALRWRRRHCITGHEHQHQLGFRTNTGSRQCLFVILSFFAVAQQSLLVRRNGCLCLDVSLHLCKCHRRLAFK
mmetsp:Transcript_31403/g.73623  ORF Transcript_31403/g.73623 Transcript_31403/m.73623 type:complete len:201 (+) Transcript_31403:373-975(+)